MATPNFFIVGAPKSGTTAMYRYLRQHPQVFMPRQKEPTFFATDLDSGTRVDSKYFTREIDEYLGLFSDATEECIGEASVWYLYSEVAAAKIHDFCPEAKIIIMLRDPVEMIYSLHSQRLFSLAEHIADFEAALEAEEDRKRGLNLSSTAFVVRGLMYRETGKYTDQIGRYLSHFGPDQVHIIIFDDFIADPERSFIETCDFLCIDSDFRPELAVHNTNSSVKSRAIQKLLRHPTPIVSRFVRALPDVAKRPLRKLTSLLTSWNVSYGPREPMSPELRSRLRVEFAVEVKRLSRLLGHDFESIWWTGSEAEPDKGGRILGE